MTEHAREVAIYFSSETLDLDQLTRLLGDPDRSFRKGDEFLVRGRPARRGYASWYLGSAGHVRSDEFTDHWDFIVAFVLKHAATLTHLKQSGTPARIRVFWTLEDDVLSATLPADQLATVSRQVEGIDLSVV